MKERPMWTPPRERVAQSNMRRFMGQIAADYGGAYETYQDMLAFSVSNPGAFWREVWRFGGVIGDGPGARDLIDGSKMQEARFFPDARLNYAENLLKRDDDAPALIFHGEDQVRIEVTWRDLRARVAQTSRALQRAGIKAGDRVCAVVPNHPETIVAFLATASLGAIWSSCSPDFGERGILDRFGQIEPKLLFTCDGYFYGGKTHAMEAKIAGVLKGLPSVAKTIVIPYAGPALSLGKAMTIDEFRGGENSSPIDYARLPFDHPLYILFSSGTTGIPKCIVHRAGGILLKHLSELMLNTDVKPQDRLFYFTTCGWMMWNWLVSGLAVGATLLLYDGSPFHPNERALFDIADEEGMTIFGTSAKYIDSVRKTGWQPKTTHKFDGLRTMLSTGSPLSAENFDFIYDAVKPDIHLASISGGTDICGCFVGGNPLSPVWRGEIQGPMLGMAMNVHDEQGHPLMGEKGELVCTKPFPSMPAMFWNDANGQKYHDAYFARFPGIWCHGDYAEATGHGGFIIHGRSDATLNPGGVRIGTAELYAQVEQIPEVAEALAIGQDWQGDVRIVLFVKLAAGAMLDDALKASIKRRVRDGASPRHVPSVIIAVADIPRTKSGKITELAVRDIVHGREVKNREALANPEALELYRDLTELRAG
jgi:acetoacetyl-CoA synthetase